MRFRWTLGIACAVLMSAMLAARAEDKKEADKKPKLPKLTAPWSKLSGLSDDQKQQIREIHGKANDEVKAIREKEDSDITALLTDDQKKELASLKEKETVDKKSKSTEDKKEPAGQ